MKVWCICCAKWFRYFCTSFQKTKHRSKVKTYSIKKYFCWAAIHFSKNTHTCRTTGQWKSIIVCLFTYQFYSDYTLKSLVIFSWLCNTLGVRNRASENSLQCGWKIQRQLLVFFTRASCFKCFRHRGCHADMSKHWQVGRRVTHSSASIRPILLKRDCRWFDSRAWLIKLTVYWHNNPFRIDIQNLHVQKTHVWNVCC